MASLQIPFSKWDWNINLASLSQSSSPKIQSKNSSHPADNVDFQWTHRSNPIESSFSNFSPILLEGQTVLVHQTSREIWLFVGLANGSIWKWSFNIRDYEDILKNKSGIQAELVMTGHRSPIKALAIAKYRIDCTNCSEKEEADQESEGINYIESLLSVDEAGELAVWNCHDGRCLLHNLRATASGKSAGYAHSISISPDYRYCILGGYSDKLVVLKLSTLEIVQIVEVGGEREPRWVRAAGFLLQDDPNLLLDYLTLNFNAPASQSLTARQFDPKVGKFVSPACSILPPTIPKVNLPEFSSCHLLTCSKANPGIAALVTNLKHVWLIDFLSGDNVQFSLDFEIDGVEFVRADLLLIWSKTGKIAFYQVYLQTKNEGASDENLSRSRSPILGHVVRKLDLVCSFPFGTRLYLKILPKAECETIPHICSSLLWMETVQCPKRITQVSVVHVEFDSECPDRTVHLHREKEQSLPLLFNNESASHTCINPTSPVTCTITIEPNYLVQGHYDGRISLGPAVNFFTDNPTTSTICFSNNIQSTQPSFTQSPITAILATQIDDKSTLIVAGDFHGQVQFWNVSGYSSFSLKGFSKFHYKKVIGISYCDEVILCWTIDGIIGMYKKTTGSEVGSYKCVHVFHPPGPNMGLVGLYWQRSEDLLLLDYKSTTCHRNINSLVSSSIHPCWNLKTESLIEELNDSDYLEAISKSDTKIQMNFLSENSIQPSSSFKSIENSHLFGGVISVLNESRQWPDLPCQSIQIDIRLLSTMLIEQKDKADANLIALAKSVLSKLLAWGISEKIDEIYRDKLNLCEGSESVRFGLIGANGNISLMLDPVKGNRFWTLSSTMTACQQLLIILLLNVIPWEAESHLTFISILTTFYSSQLDDENTKTDKNNINIETTSEGIKAINITDTEERKEDSKCFYPAAFSFITKFWQDPCEPVRTAARIIFSSTLSRLTERQKKNLINYWNDYLPSATSQDNRSTYRSAIILAIIATQSTEALPTAIIKNISESLVSLLLEDKRNIFRLAAIELIGTGYYLWQPFIHGASIFKLLYSWFLQLHSTSNTNLNDDQLLYNLTLSSILYILTTTTTNDRCRNSSNSLENHHSRSISSSKSASASAIIEEPATNILISWLNEQLANASVLSASERLCVIDLIKKILEFRPVVFKNSEHLIVELILKISPSFSNSLEILNEFEKIYGTISIHKSSQRLAVAQSSDNTIAIYDLKSGNRTCLLQGHVHPCTLVEFNHEKEDGRQLLSYSFNEACVRWWQLSSSGGASQSSAIGNLFSSLTSSNSGNVGDTASSLTSDNRPGVKPVKTVIVQPNLTDAIESIPIGSLFHLNPINVSWNRSNKTVEFRVGSTLVQTLSFP